MANDARGDRRGGGKAPRREAEAAEALALRALGWLAADPDEIGALMGAAGLSPEALRDGAADPGFLGFVLDFVLAEETRARRFAEDAGLGPEDALRARAALPGGDAMHWT